MSQPLVSFHCRANALFVRGSYAPPPRIVHSNPKKDFLEAARMLPEDIRADLTMDQVPNNIQNAGPFIKRYFLNAHGVDLIAEIPILQQSFEMLKNAPGSTLQARYDAVCRKKAKAEKILKPAAMRSPINRATPFQEAHL